MGVTVIFGGTFNPVHIGHYEMLSYLNSLKNVEKILLMPVKTPPHKVCNFIADDEDRIKMCEIMASDFDKVSVCLIEFSREGKSYTYDTVISLKQSFPNEDFVFACGGDMLVTLDEWYRFDDLIDEISFYGFLRENIDEVLFFERLEQLKKKGAKILLFDKKIPQISSSYIRENFDNAKDYIPEKIYNYLKSKGIYSGSKV